MALVFWPNGSTIGFEVTERAYRNVQQIQRSCGFSFEETLLGLTDSELEKLGIKVHFGGSAPMVESEEIPIPSLEPEAVREPEAETPKPRRKAKRKNAPIDPEPIPERWSVQVDFARIVGAFVWALGILVGGILLPFWPLVWAWEFGRKLRSANAPKSKRRIPNMPKARRGKVTGSHSGKNGPNVEGGKLSKEICEFAKSFEGLEACINQPHLWNTKVGLTWATFIQSLEDGGHDGFTFTGRKRDDLNAYLESYWGASLDGIAIPELWGIFLDEVASQQRKAG
jgi:hypothetical protein